MEYKPRPAENQIMVYFGEKVSDELIAGLGKFLGYKIAESSHYGNEVCIFHTGNDSFEEAKKNFMRYEEFIESTSIRDLELEARWDNLEAIANELEVINDGQGSKEDTYLENLIQLRKHVNYEINRTKKSTKKQS
ncbi:MAG: hypothetical protein ABIB43_00600 [archaeon]